MSPSRQFILRPVATTLMMAGVVLIGIAAYRQLPVSALPEVDYPTIQVVTFYPGASPEVMASSVTAPLERQFGQVPGLNQMTSASSQGSSIITLQFDLELDIDIAEQEVQAAINASGTYLPAGLPNPPIYNKVNPADSPILTVALTSDSMPLYSVEDMADTRLAQKISQLPGVGLVSISGGEKPAVRIEVNPTKLAGMGMTMEDLRSAIGAANVDQAKGSFDGPNQAHTIGATDQLLTPADYAGMVVKTNNNTPVKLSDVATVVEDPENVLEAAWMNNEPAVIVNIQRQPGANIINVADRIKDLLKGLTESLPAGIHVQILTDRTETIRASVADVMWELKVTIGLVVLVIFLFLRNIPGTIIPSVAVPLSIVGTFAVMYLLNYSLNNLTLMALTISTGFVVDDAIVMIENIIRYVEQGKSPREAALIGSEQIGFTIISLTVSLIAALIPLLFMGDIVGRLFREFAVTLSVTIVVSAFVSLTLTPMMCSLLLRHKPVEEQGWFYRSTERIYNGVIDFYAYTLRVVLNHQPETLLVAVATLGLTVWLFMIIPKGFFPVQDTGVIMGVSDASQDVSFAEMADRQKQLAAVILKNPDVLSLSSFIGIDGTNTTMNTGRIQINLVPLEQRKITASEVIQQLQTDIDKVPGITLFMQPVQDLTVDDRVSRTQYQYTLEEPDATDLAAWTPKLVAKLQAAPALRDVATDQLNDGPRIEMDINRDTAARLGITPQMIDDTLYDCFGQREVSIMFTQLNQYHVILGVDPSLQRSPTDLEHIFIRTASGGMVPITSLGRIYQTTSPLVISRQGQFSAVTISFNLAPGVSLGEAVDAIKSASQELNLPPSIATSFQGAAQAFQNSLANETVLIFAALATVYIVLGVLYESFIHPITILSTLPSAGVGALLALMLTHNDFDIISLIGIILLIGIVKKNAIMMIDFALQAERVEGLPPLEAIYQACLLRFRPIMMTTMAALFGGLPLWLGGGMGAELRRPLGISIVGGLIFSQALTLYTTPVIYLAFDRIARWLRGAPAPGVVQAEAI